MNSQRIKLLRKRYIELFGNLTDKAKYRRFKRRFQKSALNKGQRVEIKDITKEMFEAM